MKASGNQASADCLFSLLPLLSAFLRFPPPHRDHTPLAHTLCSVARVSQYLILTVMLVSSMAKYALLVWDARVEARGQHWANKNAWSVGTQCACDACVLPTECPWLIGAPVAVVVFSVSRMFYLEFTADLVRLFLYLLFFLIVCTYYGLPLHLIRELSITFYNLRERIVKFIRFRRVTKNMQERFADATAEELAAGDKTCIVCREDMEVGSTKKLVCGHLFHFTCLRTWLERSQSCPTCRHDIPVNGPPPPPPAPAPNNPNAQAAVAAAAGRGAGAAAAPGAPAASSAAPGASVAPVSGLQLPPGIPPLPPHLLEALRLAQAQLDPNARGVDATAASSSSGSTLSVPQRSASPLHPLFGSTPTPIAPQSTPHPMLQFPSPPHAHPHLGGHAFMSPMHPFAAHGPGGAPGGFMFPPPPPPPPPAHMFPLGPSPLAAGMGLASPFGLPPPAPATLPLGAFPSPALYASYLSHHAMLLQHHAEFLQSSLRQVQLLQEQQKDVEKRFKEQQKQLLSQHPAAEDAKGVHAASATAAAPTADLDSDEETKLAESNSTLAKRRGVKTED